MSCAFGLNLGTLCGGCVFGGSFGSGINGAGEVVGYTHVSPSQPPHAFVYRGGRMIDLGTGFGSGSSSAAWNINTAGHAVGQRARSQSSPLRATLWRGGTIRDLGTLGGSTNQPFATESIAYAINDAGEVVGKALPRAGYPLHGFVWQNGVMRDIGTLGGNTEATVAQDIANTGQIVGSSQNATGETHAFVRVDGVMRDLGTLGGNYSAAYGINDDGVIVGTTCTLFCEPGKTAPTRGFLLVPQPGTR